MAGGAEIRALVPALITRDATRAAAARSALRDTIGAAGADAVAGVAAFFDGMNRVADATGTEQGRSPR